MLSRAPPDAATGQPRMRLWCSHRNYRASAGGRHCAAAAHARRRVVIGTLAAIAGAVEAADAAWFPWAAVKDRPAPQRGPSLDPALPPLFTAALYAAVRDTGLMTEAQFQAANFRLRDREYPYYFAANRDRLARVPDLSDASGGLSNPAYFNFVYYIAWKVAAQRLTEGAAQERFLRAFGDALLDGVAPEAARAVEAARGADEARAPAHVVQAQIEAVLAGLQQRGYAERIQVVWGEASPEVPFRWEAEGAPVVRQEDAPAAGLAAFQVRLRLPADVEGSVSLRSEHEGFWSSSVSSMLQSLFRRAGVDAAVDEFFFQDQWEPPQGLAERALLFFGDPLQRVEVPWRPQSLIQNWAAAV